jgi:cytochrome c oxidase cbb3-type subunit 3
MNRLLAVFAGFLLICVVPGWGQAPPAGGRGGGGGAAFPQRPPGDPAKVARGRATYGINCNFCHGSDARGGEGGPNLLRSDIVLNDQKGEGIAPIVLNGRGEMPAIRLTPEQIADVAEFIHSFPVNNRDPARFKPLTIVVGNAGAGEAYFKATCARCHSVTGDLKGIGVKFEDPKALQNYWLMPVGGGRGAVAPAHLKPVTVTVGAETGRLVRIDDFIVTMTLADGSQKTFRRNGDTPKVTINDPMEAHKGLLTKYRDEDIHNLTAYLVTVK